MEEEVFKTLTQDEKELLGTLFESKSMRAILKSCDLYQKIKAEHVVMIATDFNNVILNRGCITGARFIYDLCKHANKKMKKDEVKQS